MKFLPSLLILSAVFASFSPLACAETRNNRFLRLVDWMKQYGGRVDDRINVATMSNGIRGIIALSDIEDGAELLFCPWKLTIGSTNLQNQMQSGDGMCKVVEKMANEIRLGDKSFWHPYLDYIELPRLAASWDTSALKELQGLPPTRDATRHIQWFNQMCEGELNDSAMSSLVAFISRASEVGMVPIYDLFNHHNGKRNAKLSLNEEGVQLLVVGGPIKRGQELYISYGIKIASTMFRDYGFVEEWPTCWNFKNVAGDNYAFILFPDGIVAINPTPDVLKEIYKANMSLEDYQILAKTHTESLKLQDLRSFLIAAKSQLEELPTTLQKDTEILERQTKILSTIQMSEEKSKSAESKDLVTAKDIVSAIEYRIAFKNALTSAVVCAEKAILMKGTGTQEL